MKRNTLFLSVLLAVFFCLPQSSYCSDLAGMSYETNLPSPPPASADADTLLDGLLRRQKLPFAFV